MLPDIEDQRASLSENLFDVSDEDHRPRSLPNHDLTINPMPQQPEINHKDLNFFSDQIVCLVCYIGKQNLVPLGCSHPVCVGCFRENMDFLISERKLQNLKKCP